VDRAASNRRRIELIDKELAEELSPAEDAELRRLQADMDRYLDTLAPLPFDQLQQLEESARHEALPTPPQDN